MSIDFRNLKKPFIIAEAGTCHASYNDTESYTKVLEYIKAAKECGADAIKFQIFSNSLPDSLFCYINGDESRSRRWLMSALVSEDDWAELSDYARGININFMASCFQTDSIRWLEDFNVCASKVASRAVGSYPYLISPRPWLISTGMGLPPLWVQKDKDCILMECESKYPSTMKWSGKYPGFSDHSANPDFAKQAIDDGCKLIEVHFYIKKEDAGPDEPASLNLDQLKDVCDYGHGKG